METEASTPVLSVGHVDTPPVGVGDLGDDLQSESGAVVVGRHARLEHLRATARFDPLAVVLDVEPIAVRKRTDGDDDIVADVSERVRQQVLEQLGEPAAVRRDGHLVENAELVIGYPDGRSDLRDQRRETDRLDVVDDVALSRQRQ